MPPRRKRSSAFAAAPPPTDDHDVKPSLDTYQVMPDGRVPLLLGQNRRRTRSSTGSLPVKTKAEGKDESDQESDDEKPVLKKARNARKPVVEGQGKAKEKLELKAEANEEGKKEEEQDKSEVKSVTPDSQTASSSTLIPAASKGKRRRSPNPFINSPATYPGPAISPVNLLENLNHSPVRPNTQNTPLKKPKIEKKPKVPLNAADDLRSGQTRKQCPVATEDRAHRVMDQRMYMIHRSQEQDLHEEFKVLGSTGNVYTVNYAHTPKCDCPDFLKGNSPCKHLLFISLKVLHIPRFPPGRTLADPAPTTGQFQLELHTTWYQKTLSTNELRAIFENAKAGAGRLGGVSVDERTRKLWAKHHLGESEAGGSAGEGSGGKEKDGSGEKVGKPGEKMDDGRRLPDVGDDCPICYDELVLDGRGQESMVYHLGLNGCGRALHQQCYSMWAATEAKVGNGHKVSCVYCRAPWMVGGGGASGSRIGGSAGIEYSGGYTNLAGLAGMDRERDVSTYYMGPRRGVKYRPWEYYED